jgi:signal transduction histidine kinase
MSAPGTPDENVPPPTPGPAPPSRLLDCLQQALGHELPNHLVAIQGLVRILDLEEAARLGEPGRDYLARLASAADRLHSLVGTLAVLVRAARRSEAPERIGLAEAVAVAVAEAKKLSPLPAMEYHHCGPTTDLIVPGRCLHHVLVQLLRTALETAAGQARVLHCEFGQRRIPGGLEVWMTDDGPGLPRERQAQWFEPFATSTGLALFSVQHLVESWGGRIRIESGPGPRTTYCFTVPDSREET